MPTAQIDSYINDINTDVGVFNARLGSIDVNINTELSNADLYALTNARSGTVDVNINTELSNADLYALTNARSGTNPVSYYTSRSIYVQTFSD